MVLLLFLPVCLVILLCCGVSINIYAALKPDNKYSAINWYCAILCSVTCVYTGVSTGNMIAMMGY